jgi:uncharacterized Zn finger protein (UPF0148 family)
MARCASTAFKTPYEWLIWPVNSTSSQQLCYNGKQREGVSNTQKERLVMNIWDSVHRGLEKASQEAARISKIQKARSQMDRLGRQLATQEQTLLDKAIALFEAGQLQQNELIPFCQEIVSLRQQFAQTQSELQSLQNQIQQQPASSQNNPAESGTPMLPPPPQSSSIERTVPAFAPPTNSDSSATSQYYAQDNPQDLMALPTIPPPPPGFYASQPTITPASIPSKAAIGYHCPRCGTTIQTNDQFCPNCGAPLRSDADNAQPTTRAEEPTTYEQAQHSQQYIHEVSIADQATVRNNDSTPSNTSSDGATVRADTTTTPTTTSTDGATIRADTTHTSEGNATS